jgi:hypothetical protein
LQKKERGAIMSKYQDLIDLGLVGIDAYGWVFGINLENNYEQQ